MKLLIQHNQEIAQLSPDPFPLLRAGSGDETTRARDTEVSTELKSAVNVRAYMRVINEFGVPPRTAPLQCATS